MLPLGMRTSSIYNLQHAATRRNLLTKRTQRVAPNNVATCCVQMLHAIVWPELANVVPTMLGYVALRCCYRLAGAFNFEPTTLNVATHRNMVAKRTQHVAPNNVAICCVGMFRSFGRGLSHRKGPFTLASCRAGQLTQSSFRHTEVATSCDFIVILV